MRSLVSHILISLCLTFSACSTHELAQFKAQLARSNCNQWQPGQQALATAPGPITNIAIPPAVTARFSPNSLHMAHAIGVLPVLEDYIRRTGVPSTERTVEQRIELLELRRTIAYRCDLASLEISAVASELDCEEEKISQLAGHLDGLEGDRESRLTVAAIAVGALGAVITGIHLADDDGSSNVDGLGIVFGVTEAALGAAILLNKQRTEVSHTRNALRAVHEGHDKDAIFPPSVWYCLVQPVPGESADHTLRQELLHRWRDAGAEQDDKALAKTALFLSDGGTYTTGQLNERAAMYDQLESSIKLVKQDLLQLVQELDALER